MNARKQYLKEVVKEYGRTDEKGRGRLLDEAEKRTGLNRKYLIRILNHPRRQQPRKQRSRRAEYGAAVVTALVAVWDIFEQPCGQRMVAVLRSENPVSVACAPSPAKLSQMLQPVNPFPAMLMLPSAASCAAGQLWVRLEGRSMQRLWHPP